MRLNSVSYLLRPNCLWNSRQKKPFLLADINRNAVNQDCNERLLDFIKVFALREVLLLDFLHSKNFFPLNQNYFEKVFTGFTVNPGVLTESFQKVFTAFLV